MHELGIITEAVRIATEAAKAAGADRVLTLKLRVGAWSGVVPEAMQFAWDVVRRNTPLAEARLEIEPVPAAFWCPPCQSEFLAEGLSNECPRCHHMSGELRRGRELDIAAVEVD